jgi:hypothetical protein
MEATMTTNISIPETSSDFDRTRVFERPDGFYWQDKLTGELSGSFATLLEAVQDLQGHEGDGFEEGESLEEAESEIGIADWIDPETGEPAEDMSPHRSGE